MLPAHRKKSADKAVPTHEQPATFHEQDEAAPLPGAAADILKLQRTVGNSAVQKMVSGKQVMLPRAPGLPSVFTRKRAQRRISPAEDDWQGDEVNYTPEALDTGKMGAGSAGEGTPGGSAVPQANGVVTPPGMSSLVNVQRIPVVRTATPPVNAAATTTDTASTNGNTNGTSTTPNRNGSETPPDTNGGTEQPGAEDTPVASSEIVTGEKKVETPKADNAPVNSDAVKATLQGNAGMDKLSKAMDTAQTGKEKVEGKKRGGDAAKDVPELQDLNDQDEKGEGDESSPELAKNKGEGKGRVDAQKGMAQNTAGLVQTTGAATGTMAANTSYFAEVTPELAGTDDPAVLDEARVKRNESGAIAGEFMSYAAGRVQTIMDSSADITARIQGASQAAKASVDKSVQQQQQALTSQFATMRKKAQGKAAAVRSRIASEHQTALSGIQEATTQTRQTVETEYTTSLTLLETKQTAALQKVEELYAKANTDYQAVGVQVGDEAKQRGDSQASVYLGRKINRRDSLTAGYLTDRRCDARAKAAREVAKQYRQGLIDAGKEQATEAMKGKGKDIENIRTIAAQSREALQKQRQAMLENIDTTHSQAVENANKTKQSLTSSVNQALNGILNALKQQETAAVQSFTDSGERYTQSLDEGAMTSISSLQQNVLSSVEALNSQLAMFQSAAAGMPAPEPEEFHELMQQQYGGLDGGVATILGQNEQATASVVQGIQGGAVTSAETLTTQVGEAITEAAAALDSFMTSMDSTAQGASRSFKQLQQAHTKMMSKTNEAAVKGFGESRTGIEKAFTDAGTHLQKAFTDALPKLAKGLSGAFKDMDAKISEEAEKAAAQEQPAWKTVLKVLLVIAVIVVVALVAGPAVIGAVGAMAGAMGASAAAAGAIGMIVGGAIVGAAAGAVIQMGNNVIDGKDLFEGVAKAALVGAIGGALGGAGGALSQALMNAGKLGASVVMQKVASFAIETALDMTGEILGNLATGQPITWEGLGQSFLMGVGIGGAMTKFSGVKGVGKIQEASMGAGSSFGKKVGGGVADSLGFTPKIEVDAPSVPKPEIDTTPPKTEVDAAPTTAKTGTETAPTPKTDADTTPPPATGTEVIAAPTPKTGEETAPTPKTGTGADVVPTKKPGIDETPTTAKTDTDADAVPTKKPGGDTDADGTPKPKTDAIDADTSTSTTKTTAEADQVGAAGGTKGDVYDTGNVNAKGFGNLSPDKLLKQVVGKMPTTRTGKDFKLEIGKMELIADDVANGIKGNGVKGKVTVDGVEVEISIQRVMPAELSPSVHGAEGGPARLNVEVDAATGGIKKATIQVDSRMYPDDARLAIGHELDELGGLVKAHPDVKSVDDLKASMEASVFKDNTGKDVTVHDRAVAVELRDAGTDYIQLRSKTSLTPDEVRLMAKLKAEAKTGTPEYQALAGKKGALSDGELDVLLRRQATVDRMFDEFGIRNADDFVAQMKALREAGKGTTDERAWRAFFESVVEQKARLEVDKTGFTPASGSIVTDKVMAHVMYPRPNDAPKFATDGLGGGHDDALMKQFLKQYPEYELVETGSQNFAGTTVRKYEQYMWNGSGPKTGSPPGPDWIQAPFPKTTVDNVDVLLKQTEVGFNEWLAGADGQAILSAGTPASGTITITTSEGFPAMMYYAFDGSKWKIASTFPDANKV